MYMLLQMPAKGAKVIAAVILTGRTNPCLIDQTFN